MHCYKNSRVAAKTHVQQSLPISNKTARKTVLNNTGLPNSLKAEIEKPFGYSMNGALLHDARTNGYSDVAQLCAKATISQPCVQMLSDKAWQTLRKNSQYIRLQQTHAFLTDPVENYKIIRGLLTNVFKSLGNDMDTVIVEVAKELDMPITVPSTPQESTDDTAVSYEKEFSVLPVGLEEKDYKIVIEHIVRYRETYPVISKDKYKTKYYHTRGPYPNIGKPFWQIDEDGKIRFVGMYQHVHDGNCKSYALVTGPGPRHINIE